MSTHTTPDSPTPSRYRWSYKGVTFDFYRLCEILGITSHAQAHALKKVIRAGRGGEPIGQDIDEAIDSLRRWKEMRQEDAKEWDVYRTGRSGGPLDNSPSTCTCGGAGQGECEGCFDIKAKSKAGINPVFSITGRNGDTTVHYGRGEQALPTCHYCTNQTYSRDTLFGKVVCSQCMWLYREGKNDADFAERALSELPKP